MNKSINKSLNILWLVEHTAREMDVACAVKSILVCKYNACVEIKNLYYHTDEILSMDPPDIVVHPFFYFLKGALATEDIVARFPNSIHFNMAWEQIHYKAHTAIKAPSDDYTKNSVIHHAWSQFYREYLLNAGVNANNIFLNGQPAYQLYKEPYCRYYKKREILAKENNIDPNSRWIFVPENFRWAFIGNKINQFLSLGGNEKEILELHDYCTASLKLLLGWCNNVGCQPGIEIIFRPRPAVNSKVMIDFLQDHIGVKSKHLHFIKRDSVREWILASDLVVSSYSTSLIEAAIAEKPLYMFEPQPFPDALYCDWYSHAPRIVSAGDFENACTGALNQEKKELKQWAESTMLSEGDPIHSLALYLHQLKGKKINLKPCDHSSVAVKTKKNYFNELTHESDIFDDSDIQLKVSKWCKILCFESKDMITFGPINKTMCRSDLMDIEANTFIRDLNLLIIKLYQIGLWMSSWVGTLPADYNHKLNLVEKAKRKFFHKIPNALSDKNEREAIKRGLDQRLDYLPLPNAIDDNRYPWFLYWEIFWVLHYMMPLMKPGAKILDAGGSSSLFTCFMASLGYEVHCVELNAKLNENARNIAKAMGWNLFPYDMNLKKLDFHDQSFDHAFSICVFEHLDFPVKQSALKEIARCLKPGGIFALTFDYRNPAPGVVGFGKDTRPQNQISNQSDIKRTFLSNDEFKLLGNQHFEDSGESYLKHPLFPKIPYTFGALFLKRVG